MAEIDKDVYVKWRAPVFKDSRQTQKIGYTEVVHRIHVIDDIHGSYLAERIQVMLKDEQTLSWVNRAWVKKEDTFDVASGDAPPTIPLAPTSAEFATYKKVWKWLHN